MGAVSAKCKVELQKMTHLKNMIEMNNCMVCHTEPAENVLQEK